MAARYTTAHDISSIPALLDGNLTLGAYLLEAMCEAGCRRLVYASTVTTRGADGAYHPLTLYAATKQAFSDLVAYYTGAGAMRAAAVALSDTYGPGDCRPKVLNLIRQSILAGTPMDLTSGRQIYDAVYIDDVVRGLQKAADALESTGTAHLFYQLSGAAPLTLRETVELLLKVNGLTFQANWGGRPDPEGMLDRLQRVFPTPPGWQPDVLPEAGLRRFWDDGSLE